MNAIILAAGMGSRFHEITKNNHKALLPIDNMPNIERTITFLKSTGIEEIIIVVGHMGHMFEYLKEKYNVTLVHNEKYKEYNNIYSLYVARSYFSDSYVIDADVVLFENIFSKEIKRSCYFTVQREKCDDMEWCPIEIDGRVKKMKITNDFIPSMLGISFWTKNDCEMIKGKLKEYHKEEILSKPSLYWDHIPVEILDHLDVTTIKIEDGIAYEMDTIENYHYILKKYDERLD